MQKNKKIEAIVLGHDSSSPCDFLDKNLNELKKENFPNLVVSRISLQTQKGKKLMKKHSPQTTPALILDNKLLLTGETRKEKIKEAIANYLQNS